MTDIYNNIVKTIKSATAPIIGADGAFNYKTSAASKERGYSSLSSIDSLVGSPSASSSSAPASTAKTASITKSILGATASTAAATSWALSDFTWKGWILVLFVLALVGINVLSILGKGVDVITPITKKITKLFVGTAGQIIGTSAEGAKKLVGGTAAVTTHALDDIEHVTTPGGEGSHPAAPSAGPSPVAPMAYPPMEPQIMASNEEGNDGEGSNKYGSGWCYIGSEQGGGRACAEVGYADKCMSGDIFPTQDICLNPSLRP